MSQIGKKIHPTNFKTMLPKEGIFAIVIKGGVVKVGDNIKVINPSLFSYLNLNELKSKSLLKNTQST